MSLAYRQTMRFAFVLVTWRRASRRDKVRLVFLDSERKWETRVRQASPTPGMTCGG